MFFGLFCPEAKGILNWCFSSIHGATWGCWELLEAENTGLGIVIASALKASFWPSHSWQEEVATNVVSLCVQMYESPCSSPSALHTQLGKTFPKRALGEKSLLWIEIFSLQALQFLNRENCKRLWAQFFPGSVHAAQQQNAVQVIQATSETTEFPLALELS